MGLHAGKWPELMTFKPDVVSALGYNWNYTGWCYRPVVFQWQTSVNWDYWNTWTTLADASTQWYPSGNQALICIIVTHLKTTGIPLAAHWKHTGYQQFFLQRHSSVNLAHWNATGLPLNYHWINVRDMSQRQIYKFAGTFTVKQLGF